MISDIQRRARAEAQAKAELESIIEMVAALDTEDADAREEATQAIQEDALSVQVRSGWYTPGTPSEPEEYEILLCTGGPAVRIVGDLEILGQPRTTRLEYQDWFIPWTEHPTTADAKQALLSYAWQFYYGEG